MPAPIIAVATVTMHLLLVLMYYVAFTPLAWLLRAVGVDVIGLRRDERAASYWRRKP